jgi:hypothetical protein
MHYHAHEDHALTQDPASPMRESDIGSSLATCDYNRCLAPNRGRTELTPPAQDVTFHFLHLELLLVLYCTVAQVV